MLIVILAFVYGVSLATVSDINAIDNTLEFVYFTALFIGAYVIGMIED